MYLEGKFNVLQDFLKYKISGFNVFQKMKNKILSIFDFLTKKLIYLIFFSLITSIVVALCETLFASSMQMLLKSIGLLQVEINSFRYFTFPSSIEGAFLFFAVVVLARGMLLFLKRYIAISGNLHFINYHRKILLHSSLFSTPIPSTHELISAFGDESNRASTSLQAGINFIQSATVAVTLLGCSIFLAPQETLVGTLILAITQIPLRKYDKVVNKFSAKITHQWKGINLKLLENIRLSLIIRLHETQQAEYKHSSSLLTDITKSYKQMRFGQALKSSLPSIVGMWGLSAVTYLSVTKFHRSPSTTLTFFYLYVRFIQFSSEALVNLQESKMHSNILKSFYNRFQIVRQTERGSSKSLTTLSPITSIKFNNVSFNYKSSHDVLKNFSHEFKKGTIVLIKGESGRGKTTLLKLILGLEIPSSGQIIVNHEFSLDGVKYSSAYAGPEPLLFQDTVFHNVTYGSQTPDRTEAITLAREIGCDFIFDLPNEFDTSLSEKLPISTGQAQRIALLRAFLRRNDLLILDEATANLDQQSESKIIAYLKKNQPNTITIIISHKDTFDNVASEILRL